MIAPTLLHPTAQGQVTLDGRKTAGQRNHRAGGHPLIQYEAFGEDEDVDRLIEVSRPARWCCSSCCCWSAADAKPAMLKHEPTLLFARSLAEEFGQDTHEYWKQYTRRFGFVVRAATA